MIFVNSSAHLATYVLLGVLKELPHSHIESLKGLFLSNLRLFQETRIASGTKTTISNNERALIPVKSESQPPMSVINLLAGYIGTSLI